MSLGPALRTPYTDLTGGILNHQMYGRCADMEMKMMDCMEAYGFERGRRKCVELISDFRECSTKKKQLQRMEAIRIERHRQYYNGESTEKFTTPPRIDGY